MRGCLLGVGEKAEGPAAEVGEAGDCIGLKGVVGIGLPVLFRVPP